MVDTVQFEGDRNHVYRILRSRFGSTAEIGIYEMLGSGLREVSNPSEILISQRRRIIWYAIASTLEGMRPLMIEIQALVVPQFTDAATQYYRI
jgi:DNA repair protein RadA/Sms